MLNENIIRRNALLAAKVIKGLESRNMSGYYAGSKKEALKLALALIPEGSSVTMGGAMSAHEIGLVAALKEGNYNFIDRDAWEDKRAAMLAAYDADVFLSSANAITDGGLIVPYTIASAIGSCSGIFSIHNVRCYCKNRKSMNSISVCFCFSKFTYNLVCHFFGDKVNSVVVVAVLGEFACGFEVYDISVCVLYGMYICKLYCRK